MSSSLQNWVRRLFPAGKPNRRRRDRGGKAPDRPRLEQLESRELLTGTWTGLTNPAPTVIGTMMMLSDGTVMAQGGGSGAAVKTWFQLTPDSSGNYANGTWSARTSMGLERLYFGSNVLPDGRVFVLGGEYSGPNTSQNFTNTGEIYNPVTNTWSNIANFPQSRFGDDPTVTLPDGRILGGYLSGPQTYIYNPATNAWTPGGTKLRNDQSDEETFLKLPDNSILTYECFTESGGVGHAQRYIPATNTWVDAGNVPTLLSGGGAFGFEMGPATMLPDGRAFFVGANGHTAYYTPGGVGTWAAGPNVPLGAGGVVQGADDSPGAMLPNGHFLVSVDHPVFGSPTNVYEFNPAGGGSFTNVTPPAAVIGTTGPCYTDRMLVLPNGQVLLTTGTAGGTRLAVWTTNEAPSDSWRPAATSISGSGGTFTLTGTLLNGISEGSSYGDDAEMSSNYPIVRLQSGSTVTYARTFNWSSTGVDLVGSTAPRSVQFTEPVPRGIYLLNAIANGIASPTVLNVQMTAATNNLAIRKNPGAPVNVQVVNANTSAVLAEYPLSALSSILVTGDTSADTLTVDDSFGNPLPGGGLNYQAGSGTDLLNVNDQATAASQTFTLAANSLQRAGGPAVSYSGLADVFLYGGGGGNTFNANGTSASTGLYFDGGTGNNTVVGASPANTWLLFAPNQGNLFGAAYGNAVTFADVQNLRAGAGGDYFAFYDGASVSGNISGRGTGQDYLDYSAYTTSVVVDLRTGSATGVGGTLSGISAVAGGSGTPAGPGVYNLLIGNGGADLYGGFGRRNVLVAGGSPGVLIGGDGEDLLIGGSTIYDTQAGLANWRAIASYWAGTDPYATRSANVVNGVGVPRLDATTVSGNGGNNYLAGNGALGLIFTDGVDAVVNFDPASRQVLISP